MVIENDLCRWGGWHTRGLGCRYNGPKPITVQKVVALSDLFDGRKKSLPSMSLLVSLKIMKKTGVPVTGGTKVSRYDHSLL